jgi:hypothetical protein
MTYGEHLSYANLRGSSELEFAPDDVAILVRADKGQSVDPWTMTLRHEKCRHGPTRDKTLLFHRSVQTFEEKPPEAASGTLDDELRQDFADEDF